MTLADWQQEVLEEVAEEERRSARYFQVSFVSRSAGHGRKRRPRDVVMIRDAQLNICHTLNEDWFTGADEVEYHLTGNALIQRVMKYGYA